MNQNSMPLLFEKSLPGKVAYQLPHSEVPNYLDQNVIPGHRTTLPELPELSEIELVRHYTNLSTRNHGVDTGFYPLGSCTMKYNPKVNEDLATLSGFTKLHPLAPEITVQGSLELISELETSLAALTGMDQFTLQPAAGAHGEFTALLMIKAYHQNNGELSRNKVLVPASAHGTNPASAVMAGFETATVKCNEHGLVDLEHLKTLLDQNVAALMLTNPNTLGLFETEISEIAELVHAAGGLLYYDGANLNAIMGLVRPGDMGFDLVHLNLHKTFATPHGGGGPGSGPVGVKGFLAPYLPIPLVVKNKDNFAWDYNRPKSIGKVSGFYGNFSVLVKALAYIHSMGAAGLTQVSHDAILNANYLRVKLKDTYLLPHDRPCMHEFVLSAVNLKQYGIRALDVAKRLLDFGIHPPTIYFPLIVEEAMMIEPTETEDLSTLDEFIGIMKQIAQEAAENPELLHQAPQNTPVGRLDEALAARSPKLCYRKPG